jgi:hypothetical protein
VPAVRFGGPAGEPGFELGKVVNEMISHPPYCFVGGVEPGRLTLDGYLEGTPVPPRPGCRQVQHVVHHAGHDVGGVAVIGLGSGIGHEHILARRTDIGGAVGSLAPQDEFPRQGAVDVVAGPFSEARYQVGVLQVVDLSLPGHSIEEIESWWKRKLMTREHGLNRN